MPGHELIVHPALGQYMTLETLAAAVDMHPDLVAQFVTYGLVEPMRMEERELWFGPDAMRRLRTMRRLREDLGINLPGIAVVLDLLERIEMLQRKLAKLRRE
jgi:hypothetical protein